MTDDSPREQRRPLSTWAIEREDDVAGQRERVPVGDLSVWPKNGNIRLWALHPIEYVVFPKFKDAAEKTSKEVEHGKFIVKVSLSSERNPKGWLATVGELELDEKAGTGSANFHLFSGKFFLSRRPDPS